MDTQPNEAVASDDANAPAATPEEFFENMAAEEFGVDDEEQPVEGDNAEVAEDETDIEEEADDLPPIDAPVSWDAEAKEVFANLPREAQEIVAKRETERERFVQQKSQEAAQAKQTALQQATSELAQIERGYAQHFQSLAEQLQPQRPNPQLLQYDPQAFYAQQADYEAKVAQQHQLQQQAQDYAQQAQQREAQIEHQQRTEQQRLIVEQFPEYIDPTTGPKLQQELAGVARELGYSPELISQARAEDILAMRTAAKWKADSLKLAQLNAKKMEKVRAAKGLPKVAKPGVSQGSDQLRTNRANAAFETAKTAKNRDVAGAGFHDYLKATGQI
jgi:hypothetical protein